MTGQPRRWCIHCRTARAEPDSRRCANCRPPQDALYDDPDLAETRE